MVEGGTRNWNARHPAAIRFAAGLFLALLLGQPADASFRAAAGGLTLFSDDGVSWTNGIHADLLSVAHGAGRWVAVGAKGLIQTSTDGRDWTVDVTPTGLTLNEVATDGARWVAVGDGATILTSPDGVSWQRVSCTGAACPPIAYDLKGVAHGPGLWFAVASQGTVLTSPNSITWTAEESGYHAGLNGVASDGKLVVAVGNQGGILTRQSAGVWAVDAARPGYSSGVASNRLSRVRYGDGQWLAVGEPGAILTSQDGSTWVTECLSGSGAGKGCASTSFSGAARMGAGWVALGSKDVQSQDGVVWSAIPSPTGPFAGTASDAASSGPTWIAVGGAGSIDLSLDAGVTWQRVQGGVRGGVLATDGAQWLTATLGVTTFGPAQGFWAGASPNAMTAFPDGLAWNGSMWVMVGELGEVSTSPDGKAWTLRQGMQGNDNALYAVIRDGDGWLAVGHSGRILSSLDGIAWTQHPAPTGTLLTGVATDGARRVVVGYGGTILTATPDSGWVLDASPVNRDLFGVAYDGRLWVAVGAAGTILTSPDGIAWTLATSPGSMGLHAVATDCRRWVAVGDTATILGSDDGVTWNETDPGLDDPSVSVGAVVSSAALPCPKVLPPPPPPPPPPPLPPSPPPPPVPPPPSRTAHASVPKAQPQPFAGEPQAAVRPVVPPNATVAEPAARPASPPAGQVPDTPFVAPVATPAPDALAVSARQLGTMFLFQANRDSGAFGWDFGDGSPVDARMAPSHAYGEAGVHLVRLMHMGADGHLETALQRIVSVDAAASPRARTFQPAAEQGVPAALLLAGVAVAVQVGWLATRGNWPYVVLVFFSRLRNSDVARHPARAAILDLLAAHPALHENALERLLGKDRSSLRHHLRVLVAAGLLRTYRWEGTKSYALVQDNAPEGIPQAAALRGPQAQALLGIIEGRPGIALRDLVQESGLNRTTVRHHLMRLKKAGLVEGRKDGRRLLLFRPTGTVAGPGT